MLPLWNMDLAKEHQQDLLEAGARNRRAPAAGRWTWTIAAGTGLVSLGLRLLGTAREDVPLVVRRPRRGRKPVLAPALAGLAVMTAAVGWATAPWLLLVLMAVLGMMSGTAGVPPGAMLSDLAPSDRQETAVGLFRFCGDLGFTLGPLLAGWAVPALGFRWTFTLLAGPTVGALVLILRAPETLRPAASG